MYISQVRLYSGSLRDELHWKKKNNKTDRRDITEILLKVTLNTITLTLYVFPDLGLETLTPFA
jgi:hypothetical protein